MNKILRRPRHGYKVTLVRSGCCMALMALFGSQAMGAGIETYTLTTTGGDPSYPITGTFSYDTSTQLFTDFEITPFSGSLSDYIDTAPDLTAEEVLNAYSLPQPITITGGGPPCIAGATGAEAIFNLLTACAPAPLIAQQFVDQGVALVTYTFTDGIDCVFGECEKSVALTIPCAIATNNDFEVCPSLPSGDDGLIISTYNSTLVVPAPTPTAPEPASGTTAAIALLALAFMARQRMRPGLRKGIARSRYLARLRRSFRVND